MSSTLFAKGFLEIAHVKTEYWIPFPPPPKKETNNREKLVTLATDRSLVSSASRSQILNLQAKFEIDLVTNSGQGDGNLWPVESFWFPGTGTGTSSFYDVVSSRLFIPHSAKSANWSHSAQCKLNAKRHPLYNNLLNVYVCVCVYIYIYIYSCVCQILIELW